MSTWKGRTSGKEMSNSEQLKGKPDKTLSLRQPKFKSHKVASSATQKHRLMSLNVVLHCSAHYARTITAVVQCSNWVMIF